MQILNDRKMQEAKSETDTAFWEMFDLASEKIASETCRIFHDQSADIIKELHRKIMTHVKKRMPDGALRYYSQPSVFMREFLLAFMDEAETVKREEVAEAKRKGLPAFLQNYDVEEDIRHTRTLAMQQLESQFQFETAFLKALQEDRLEEAKTILDGIRTARKDADLLHRVEELNWRLDLASRMGSIEMLLDAVHSLRSLDEVTLSEETLKFFVKRLLILKGLQNINIRPTMAGANGTRRAESPVAFFQKHTDTFADSWLKAIVKELVKEALQDTAAFKAAVGRAFEESRIAFLSSNPYIADLRVNLKW